jgi:hypothetical protein
MAFCMAGDLASHPLHFSAKAGLIGVFSFLPGFQ